MAQEEKLDWIYKGANSLVDREEYLLGRKVDKTLEQINEEEKEKKIVLPTPKNHVEHECIPPSIRDFNKIVLSEQVDISAKLQEDPLVAIKKREEEARRQFLQNPVQLKKLQEALKKQEEKKQKHKKSKKKNSNNLDEKIKEKLKLLKQNSLGNDTQKKKFKKNKEDALNVILMHKFNALKDKLSEEDMQDILNGKVSDDSDNDTLKKNKKTKSDSSESDNGRNERTYKHRGDVSLQKHERRKKKDRSSSSGSDDGKSKVKKLTYKGKRECSLEKDSRKNRSPYRRRDKNPRESSCEDKYKKHEKNNSRKEYDKKSGRNRSRERSRSIERNVYKDKNSISSRRKRRSRSNSEEKLKESARKDKIQRKENTKLSKTKYRKHSESSSDDELDTQRRRFKKDTKSNDKSDNDLDEKILAKLRILRGEVETKIQNNSVPQGSHTKQDSMNAYDDDHDNQDSGSGVKQKIFLPTKPPHLSKQRRNTDSNSEESTDKHLTKKVCLKNQRKSSHTSSSEEEVIKKNYKYSDSEEEQPQPKTFGLVTSDGKKIAFKKTDEYKKVNNKTPKKNEPTKKPERKNVRKLTEEEKDKLRIEMILNAQVRDKEREHNVKRYKENESKEEEITKQNFDADAIHNKLLKSAKISSVEQRIKSNLNNIQRSSRHMDSNFSKR